MKSTQGWRNTETDKSHSYTCGHCNNSVASNVGYFRTEKPGHPITGRIYICHFCGKPSYFDADEQVPGRRFGGDVKGISDASVEKLYNEARDCFSKGAFTAVVLCCRKLLMHIAVSKGAAKNKYFIEYVEYISKNGYVPPDAKAWVDHIRTKGNEANHEISIMPQESAEDLLTFIEMILKLIFEFPLSAKKYTAITTP